MNHTLFNFGSKKEEETKKGTKYDVTPTMDTSVKLDSKIPCAVCQKLFSGKQYLDMYIHFKHADNFIICLALQMLRILLLQWQ